MQLNFNGKAIEFKSPLTINQYMNFAKDVKDFNVVEISPYIRIKAMESYESLSKIEKTYFFVRNFQLGVVLFRDQLLKIKAMYRPELDSEGEYMEWVDNIFRNIDITESDEKARIFAQDLAKNFIIVEPLLEKELGFVPELFPVSRNEAETPVISQ